MDSGQEATVFDVRINATDLLVDVVSTAAAGPTLTLTVAQGEGRPIASQTVSRSATGSQTVTFPGAMVGAEEREIGYWVLIADGNGVPLMDPFPFSILFECPPWASCTYYPIPGVLTSGLLVTETLWNEISGDPSCDLVGVLEAAVARQPKLRPDVTTLARQLQRLGAGDPTPSACSFAWLTVVPKSGAWVMERVGSHDTSDESIWELEGGSAGAAICYNSQARTLGSQAGQTSTFRSGRSALASVIRCVAGGSSCAGGCAGSVATDFSYSSCAVAEAQTFQRDASAQAGVEVTALLSINQEPLFSKSQNVAASATFPEVDEQVDVIVDAPFSQTGAAPMAAVVTAATCFSVGTALDSGPISPGQPACLSPGPGPRVASTKAFRIAPSVQPYQATTPPTPPTAAYAYAEIFDTFALQAVSRSLCTLQTEPVISILQTPAYDVASRGTEIKIRRWADPP